MRLRSHELLDGLRAPILTQGGVVCHELAVAAADPERHRVLLTPARTGALRRLAVGPAYLAATSPEGLVRVPCDVVESHPDGAAVVVDVLLAEFEGRRRQWRHHLQLAIRGQGEEGGMPWSATTLDVSAGGALVDRALTPGSRHRVVLDVGGTELRIGAAVTRWELHGTSAVAFCGLSDAASHALGLALLRTAARAA